MCNAAAADVDVAATALRGSDIGIYLSLRWQQTFHSFGALAEKRTCVLVAAVFFLYFHYFLLRFAVFLYLFCICSFFFFCCCCASRYSCINFYPLGVCFVCLFLCIFLSIVTVCSWVWSISFAQQTMCKYLADIWLH